MTVERQYGLIIFTCDRENSAQCEGELETETADWGEALSALRSSRWRAFPLRPGPGYIHCCPCCTVPR